MIILNQSNDVQDQAKIELLSISRTLRRSACSENTHTVTDYTLYFAHTGAMNALVNGETVLVPDNHFLLIRPGQELSYVTMDPNRTQMYCMTFAVENVAAVEQISQPWLVGKNAHICDLFYHLDHANRTKKVLNTTVDALVALILEQCLSGIQRSKQAGDELFRRFCDYVDSNLDGDLSADSIAEALCYNKDYICRIVKQFSGQTMKEYITCERLYLAKSMLARRNCPISEISKALGFSSDELFTKFFRYWTDMTPTEYKRLYPEK